jgi:hypothetical protein
VLALPLQSSPESAQGAFVPLKELFTGARTS